MVFNIQRVLISGSVASASPKAQCITKGTGEAKASLPKK